MAKAKKFTEQQFRQSKYVWEARCFIPEKFKDKMAAWDIAQKPQESVGSKIPRSLTVIPGTILQDEEFGYFWEVVKICGLIQNVNSRKPGKAPIVWLRLISITPETWNPFDGII